MDYVQKLRVLTYSVFVPGGTDRKELGFASPTLSYFKSQAWEGRKSQRD